MWASGQLLGTDTSDIYSGSTLNENTIYYVRVRTNDSYENSEWIYGTFETPASTPTSTSTPVTGGGEFPPIITPTITPTPINDTIQIIGKIVDKIIEIIPEPIIETIEQITIFVSSPFNWFLLAFTYLGVLIANILTRDDQEMYILDTILYGTIAWISVLIINIIYPIIFANETISVIIFLIFGFILGAISSFISEIQK